MPRAVQQPDAAAAGPPHGTEVLLIEASIDPKFRELLLKERAKAAETLGVKLSPVEAALLNDVPEEHLRKVIAQTAASKKLRAETRRKAAKVALAALGVGAFACGYQQYAKHLDHLDKKRNPPYTINYRNGRIIVVHGMVADPNFGVRDDIPVEEAYTVEDLTGQGERELRELDNGKE
ncbi:MAG: hypothetical protein FJ291_25020 [Planctomycetes bacterium]|nr:hypothetical protein [Planctomycetota bacterium]